MKSPSTWKIVGGLILILCLNTQAQVNVGAKAGGNLHNLYKTSFKLSSPKLGWLGGLYLKMKMHETFGAQIEILYGSKGGKIPRQGFVPGNALDSASGEFDIQISETLVHSLQTLEIPFLVKLYAPGFTNSEPNLFFGPYYSRHTSYKVTCTRFEFHGSNPEAVTCPNIPGEENLTNNEFGWIMGLGIDFGLGTFDLKWAIGLTDTINDEDEVWKSNTFSATFGFSFTNNIDPGKY